LRSVFDLYTLTDTNPMAIRPKVKTIPPINDGLSNRLHGTGSGFAVVEVTGDTVLVVGAGVGATVVDFVVDGGTVVVLVVGGGVVVVVVLVVGGTVVDFSVVGVVSVPFGVVTGAAVVVLAVIGITMSVELPFSPATFLPSSFWTVSAPTLAADDKAI